jgi:hypothetical protein
MEGFKRGNQGGGVKQPRRHLEVWILVARRGQKRRGWQGRRGEEGDEPDMQGPHVEERGEKRRHGGKAQTQTKNVIMIVCQWRASQMGRLRRQRPVGMDGPA